MYADFTYYVGSFFGSAINEADFSRLAKRASDFLDYYTMGKSKDNPDLDALKDACCAIAEQYQIIESAQKIAAESITEGTGNLKSESVGSYSVSYQTAGEKATAAASAAEVAKKSLGDIARQYLAHTGLLYRGRCCGCMLPTL